MPVVTGKTEAGDLIKDTVEIEVKNYKAKTNIPQIQKSRKTLDEYSSKLDGAFQKGLEEVQKTMNELDEALNQFDIEEGEVVQNLSGSEVEAYEAVVQEASVLTAPTTVGVLDEKGWKIFSDSRNGNFKVDSWGKPIRK